MGKINTESNRKALLSLCAKSLEGLRSYMLSRKDNMGHTQTFVCRGKEAKNKYLRQGWVVEEESDSDSDLSLKLGQLENERNRDLPKTFYLLWVISQIYTLVEEKKGVWLRLPVFVFDITQNYYHALAQIKNGWTFEGKPSIDCATVQSQLEAASKRMNDHKHLLVYWHKEVPDEVEFYVQFRTRELTI
jgi:hypothetical protein